MKRLAALFALLSLSYLFFTPSAYAVIDPCSSAGTQFVFICKLGANADDIGRVLASFVTLLLILAVIIAVLYLILGGIKWITSRGDKAEVETARNHIVAAVIGLIVVFLAFFIINFVLQFLIGSSLINLPLPGLPRS